MKTAAMLVMLEMVAVLGTPTHLAPAQTTATDAQLPGESAETGIISRAQRVELERLSTQIRGEYRAIVHVVDPDGKPVSGLPWTAKLLGYSAAGTTVAQGLLPSSGTVEVPNLAGTEVGLKYRGASMLPDYAFEVGDEQIGTIQVYVSPKGGGQALPLPGGAMSKEFTFHVAPIPGQMAPDIELQDVASSRSLHLSDLRGQVVLLDFWCVGCGACQKPLTEFRDLAVRRVTEWSGRVTILGASLDRTARDAEAHIQRKGWTGGAPVLLHAWCPVDAREFDAGEENKAMRTYAIRALPSTYLIDRAGRITWRGVGEKLDAEQEIAKLLK
jgi:peroxiredoxin